MHTTLEKDELHYYASRQLKSHVLIDDCDLANRAVREAFKGTEVAL